MRREVLLQKTFENTLDFIHKKRRDVLLSAAGAVIDGARLTLTSIGRHLSGPAKERSQIRKMDRLLGNNKLHREKQAIHTGLNGLLMVCQRPVISVDWSCLSYAESRYLLRASLSVKGRSISCYQEVHPRKDENNKEAHDAFLESLREVLPKEVTPIIVTDAAFSTLWFKKVLSFGWDFVGRVRKNRGSFYSCSTETWRHFGEVYAEVKDKATRIDKVLLTKRNKLECELIGCRKQPKNRHKKNKKGTLAKGTYNEVHAKSSKEPWVLASSLSTAQYPPEFHVSCYAKRMQIEEEFRDTKNPNLGFGLSASGSRIFERVEVLLLINLIAAVYAWILGCMIINKNEHTDYHANSLKKVNVLSTVNLGRRVYRRAQQFYSDDIKQGLQILLTLIQTGEFAIG